MFDPTAWDGVTDDDRPEPRPIDAAIVLAVIIIPFLLVIGAGFWFGRVTA